MPQPTNLEIAEIFLRIGDMLDYLDDNTFKIRSYWAAAESLRRLKEPLADLAANNEISRVRGIGDAIEGKIREILETGTCKLNEELKAAVPEGVRNLLSSALLTPKLVRVVVRGMGVTDPGGLWEGVQNIDLENLADLNQNERSQVLRAAFAFRALSDTTQDNTAAE